MSTQTQTKTQTQKRPRLDRALIRAGSPYVPPYCIEQLRQAHHGDAMSRFSDGRYYLKGARSLAKEANDPLRVHIRQRVYLRPSALIVAESLRQVVQAIADAGNRPAKLLVLAMDSGIYHGQLSGNHYAYREKQGLVSYCPAGRTQGITDAGRWERAGRQETTPARWVRSVLRPSTVQRLKDHEVAEFAEKFRAEELRGAVTLEESADYEAAYRSVSYISTDNALYSCMWDDPVRLFYEGTPCRVLIARRGDGKLMGRAIIWDNVSGTGGARFMDRVYSASPEIREMFIDYAKTHGIWKKDKESAQCRTWLKPDGTLSYAELTVEHRDLEAVSFYPYMDTFNHSCGDTLTSGGEDGQEYAYSATNGTREELDTHKGMVQLDCGDWIDEEDACEVDGSWYHIDQCVTCERSGEWILIADAYRVELSRNNTVYIHEDYVNRA